MDNVAPRQPVNTMPKKPTGNVTTAFATAKALVASGMHPKQSDIRQVRKILPNIIITTTIIVEVLQLSLLLLELH